MGCWYFKQPNGLYGRFSTVVDTVTHYNLSLGELYQDMVDRFGKYDYDVVNFDKFVQTYGTKQHKSFFIHNFDDVIESMTDANMTTEKAQEYFISVGMPENEAKKYYFMETPKNIPNDDPIWDSWSPYLQKKD